MPPRPVFLNGRFAAQPLTGVQRFATEITQAWARLPGTAAQGTAARGATMLLPHGVASPALPGLAARPTGRRHGHAWEQLDLPWAARGGLLVNLGNTAPLLQRRQIVVIHDAGVFATPESYGRRFRLWYRVLHRALARQARLVTVSEFARADLARHLHLDPAAIAVVPEGAEHVLRPHADDRVLAAHGLVAGRYVLAVGSLAPHKNLAALSCTAAALAQRGLTLAVTGGLNAKVFAGGPPALPQPARYLGRVDDAQLRALYQSAACFVFPSRYEGFGLPAIEAMACGCPVAAARAGSLPEVCGEAAAYFDPGDPADIARVVDGLVQAPQYAAELRRRGQARAGAFTWDAAAQLLEQAIRDAMSWPASG